MEFVRKFCARYKYPLYVEFDESGRFKYSTKSFLLTVVGVLSITAIAAVVVQVLVTLCFLAQPLGKKGVGFLALAFVPNSVMRVHIVTRCFMVICFVMLAVKRGWFEQ